MITPQSEISILNKVRLFNINLKENEKAELFNIIQPINSTLNANDKNSIYVFKDGEMFHSEALVNINGSLRNSKSVGKSIQDSLTKLVPITIKSASKFKGGFINYDQQAR